MPAISRKESEERHAAVLRFFMENPRATGEEAQRALLAGRLTGKKGPPMGTGALFRVKRQAEELLAKGERPPSNGTASPFKGDSAALDDEQLQALRQRAQEIQKLMGDGGVMELHITRDGIRVVRLRPTEEKL
jgi:hypothetical protein